MDYSVWNWGSKRYDYYHTDSNAPFVPQSRSLPSSSFGIAPEDAAVRLPKDAIQIGSGKDAKGYIAIQGSEGSSKQRIAVIAGLLIAAFGLWKIWKN